MHVEYDYTEEVLKYSKEMDESDLRKYVNRVYATLMELQPEKTITVKNMVKKRNVNLFIAVVQMYISHQKWSDIEFKNGFSVVRKVDISFFLNNYKKFRTV